MKNIPFLNLSHNSGLEPWDDNINNLYFSNADGCHPNDEGHKLITNIIAPFIKNIIEN